jgi:hypothetical protein
MKEKDSPVRIYVIDKPGFLSCGRAYVTNTQNKIIMEDEGYGASKSRLVFRSNHDMPYTLAPYPVKNHKGGAPIKKGTRVYPSCDIDTPSWQWEDGKKDFNPTILDMVVLSQEELQGYVTSYLQQAQNFGARVASDLKKVDEKYGKKKKEIEAKIRAEKAKVKKGHIAPDLVQLVLKHSKNQQ